MSRPRTIAIDGPAGSGKSSISQQLAERFGYAFVDTGAFYRAITYMVLQAGLPMEDAEGIEALARDLKLSVNSDGQGGLRVIANDQDVTGQLRSPQVEAYVSVIAKMPQIRRLMLPLQRQVAEQGQIILAGRDIGTIVLPDADLKIYLDASLEVRTRRRHHQALATGESATLEMVEKGLAKRDKIDSERSVAPLMVAEDAIYILTDRYTLEEVVQQISQIIQDWPGHLTKRRSENGQ